MFFKVKTSSEVLELLEKFEPVAEEQVPLSEAQARVLSRDLIAPEDLPGFERSIRDGYAVKAKDTFGASESLPALLEVTGEVQMGQAAALGLAKGQAIKIATGGMLPSGADGVVMVEYTHALDEKQIEVLHAVSPGEYVIHADDDVRKGTLILEKGSFLRPQEIGLLAGLGFMTVPVFKKPLVAIISTGDEVVPVDQKPGPGRIRDVNGYTLAGFCRQWGGVPIHLGLCPDDFDLLKEKVAEGLAQADTVWISGGSSIGTRDWTLKVMESFKRMELLAHGVAISPGKPTIVAQIESKAVFGLPGHPVSTMVVAEIFLLPLLAKLGGWDERRQRERRIIKARLSRNVESASGREDYIRVKLLRDEGGWVAEPVFGKSGLISILVQSDGLVKIERHQEGLPQGQMVEVLISGFPAGERGNRA